MMAEPYSLREVEIRSTPRPGTEAENPEIAVSATVFAATDAEYPTFFMCGGNNGILNKYVVGFKDERTGSGSLFYSWTQQLVLGSGINDIALSGDSTHAAVAMEDGTIRLIDTNNLRQIDVLGTTNSDGPITCVCYTPQSNLLIAGTYAGTVHIYDGRAPRKLLKRLSPAHALPVSAVASHPDGSVFLSTGIDGIARVWDATGPLLATIVGSENRGLGSGVFSPNGRFALLGALADGSLGLWDLAHSGRLKWVRKYPRNNMRYWMRATFMKDGTIVGGSEDGNIFAWDPCTTEVIARYDIAKSKGIKIPLACCASNSLILCGGMGSAYPVLLELKVDSDNHFHQH